MRAMSRFQGEFEQVNRGTALRLATLAQGQETAVEQAVLRSVMLALSLEVFLFLLLYFFRQRRKKSGREDSNLRPQRPERCALTRLSYAPFHMLAR